MGKKKKLQLELERKITKVFLKNPNKEFNYKQISAALNVKDTKGRNEVIKSITKMHNKKKLISPARGRYVLSNNQANIIKPKAICLKNTKKLIYYKNKINPTVKIVDYKDLSNYL